MGLTNLKSILRGSSGLDAVKLLLLQSIYSRPRYAGVAAALLRPFFKDGEMPVHFETAGRHYQVYIRKSDQESDFFTLMEIGVRHVYDLDPTFAPDLVIDGGGNIGLFTLKASAIYPAARIIICEPVPRNLAHLQKHLSVNNISAKIMPVCVGGTNRTIPFYMRESISGSFDPGKPYDSQLDVEVLTLAEMTAGEGIKRICIKLDIEGMEIEALEAYVPGETRPVLVVGELHDHKRSKPILERIFGAHAWSVNFEDANGGEDLLFTAHSPAALARKRSTLAS